MTRILILVGSTGSGKTATAIELCRRLNGEIISADSMQIYRGCDIVTAKATPAERQAAPHHLIDICDPRESYSAARWAHDAQGAIAEIESRGKVPIIAGGTGFYINALLHPETLAVAPPDLELRAELETQVQEHGNQWLHDKLKSLDAEAAERLHPNDLHRVMRAIEIALSGQQSEPPTPLARGLQSNAAESIPRLPFSTGSEHSPLAKGGCPLGRRGSTQSLQPQTFGLNLLREKLYSRLNQRVDQMLQAGALDELKRLLASGVPRDAPALQGVGYRQLLPILEDEEWLPEATALWKRDTRRYAKRQMTWFRHQLPVTWISIDETTSAEHIASQIVAQWNAPK